MLHVDDFDIGLQCDEFEDCRITAEMVDEMAKEYGE